MKPSLVFIGLGNPNPSYEHTRHNAGFMAADLLAKEYGQGEWKEQPKFQSLTLEARIVTVPILIVKPLTYMNLSGEAAGKIVDFYKLDASSQIIVCCDDIDIPLGSVRFRTKGSAGTHNGLKSLCDRFGENYPRLRLGIGPKPAGRDLATWVLSNFDAEEEALLLKAIDEVPEIVKKFVMEEERG